MAESDEALIHRARRGDLDAFNQLILRYQNMAWSVAYRLLRDPDAAADAVQESFIKAFRALDSFQGGNFKSWLMRIVSNTAYDLLRARKRRATDSLEDLPMEQEYITHLTDRAESPHERAERRELAELLEEAIDSLPEDQRLVLLLSDVEGYSYDEIAEILEIPVGTVKSRLSRGRSKVRDYLARYSEQLPMAFRRNSEVAQRPMPSDDPGA